ncbi:UNVERIFIED_CONTAM: hypothetical protein HDU68_012081 [Siphonaria sp. JEL0065]|nr:hypothetical protein HDU68_012081 [Siphonaria sp. JEL0065]
MYSETLSTLPSSASKASAKLEDLLLSLSVDEFDTVPGPSSAYSDIDQRFDAVAGGNAYSVYDRRESQDSTASFDYSSVTLGQLQMNMSTISGNLEKHSTSENRDPQWVSRFFLLGETGRLYIFRSEDPTSSPISHLQLSNCYGYVDPIDYTPIIRVQGPSTSSNGSAVNRTWTLRCPNDETMALWLRAINRIMCANPGTTFPKRTTSVGSVVPRLSRASAVSLSNSLEVPMSPLDSDAAGLVPPRLSSVTSRAMSRTGSTSSSTRSVSAAERDAVAREQYQEYIAMKEASKERIQRELALKREKEAKQRATEIVALEEKRLADEAKMKEEARKAELERKKAELEKKKVEMQKKKALAETMGIDTWGGYGIHNM